MPGLLKQNFSFIEIGTVTPLPQVGNSKPRVFRVLEEKSIINKLGFPNLGASKIFDNLYKVRKYHTLGLEPLIGVNIGCNKNTKNPKPVMIKNINIIGVHWSAYKEISLKKFRKSNTDLIQLWKDKKLNPLVSNIFRLEDANMGLDILRNRRAKGKVVIDMGK